VDALFAHPPQRKRQRVRRGRVEPLDVVDGKHDRPVCRESLQCAADSNAERTRICAGVGVLDEECHLERAPPRRRQRRQDSLEHVLEQVAEARVGESSLGLGGPRHENTQLPLTRSLHTRKPERRLPDPCGAVEHQGSRTVGLVEKRMDRAELRLPADDRA
jgi:hypothetical protein